MKCFFDHKTSGHHREYLNHLILAGPKSEVVYYINEEFRSLFGERHDINYMSINGKASAKVVFEKVKNIIAIRDELMEVVFLELDFLQLEIAKNSNNGKVKFSGILFSPPLRLVNRNSLRLRMKTKVKRLKRLITLRLLTMFSQINAIYILSDEWQVSELNKSFSNEPFTYLADPIFQLDHDTMMSKKKRVDSKRTYIIFGTIDIRKNTINIIKALGLLQENVKILIVGKSVNEEHEKNITSNLALYDNIECERYNEFVSDEKLFRLIDSADIVLACYLEFYGSSGVLNHSVLHRKPILVSNIGLMPSLVKDYGLGITCNPYDVVDMAAQINNFKNFNFSISINKFVLKHSIGNFVDVLLREKPKNLLERTN